MGSARWLALVHGRSMMRRPSEVIRPAHLTALSGLFRVVWANETGRILPVPGILRRDAIARQQLHDMIYSHCQP